MPVPGPFLRGPEQTGQDAGLQVLCTHLTVSTLPSLGTRLTGQEGTDREGRVHSAGGEGGGSQVGLLQEKGLLPASP